MTTADEPATNTALSIIGAVVVGGCMFVALQHGPALGTVLAGLILGTLYGLLALASAWFPLGPTSFPVRAILSIVVLCVGALVVLGGLIALFGSLPLLLVGGMLFAQWLLAQVPFWSLVACFHVQVLQRSRQDPADANEREIGFRQMMFLTLVFVIPLAVVGTLLSLTDPLHELGWSAVLSIGFVAVVDAVIVFPLTISLLLQRGAVPATVVAGAVAILIIAMEIPVIQRFEVTLSDAAGFLWSTNAIRIAWVLGVLLILRASGYRLVRLAHQGGNLCLSAKVSLPAGR